MGKSTPKPPTPPDPVATANAQAAANQATAQQEAELNRYNQVGPTGNVNWQAPTDGSNQWTQTTTLSPEQQAIYNQQTQAQSGALGIANQQLGNVQNALNTPFSYNSLPGLQYGVQGGNIQQGFDQGQAVQGQVGADDFGDERARVEQALWDQARSRLDPMWQERESGMNNMLANQGFSMNSTGAQNAYGAFGRDRNDAYNTALYGAITGAGAEQSRLWGQELAQGQFANQAAGQQYAQNQGQAAFANTAQQQAYQQALANANLNNATRDQAGQEMAYAQNLPIQQFSALMSGNQVTMPTQNFTPTGVAPTDYLGAQALYQQQANANYQTAAQQQAGMLGGLFQLGGSIGSAAIMASDARLKTDIEPFGKHNGRDWWFYRYLWDAPSVRRLGVMAQQLLKTDPGAVVVHPSGYLMVNYASLV